jgi:transposase
VIVQKAFKYRLFPTDDQAAQLAKTFGCARYVYNQALNYRSQAWLQEKKSPGYHDTALKLTAWKQETEKAFLSEFSLVVLQQSLRNLDTAFTNFFEMRAQYPKFKSRRHRQSARYVTNAFTFRVRAAAAIRVWQCGTRSTLVGPGTKQFDASLLSDIMLGRDGRRSLRLRGEVSNVTNTPQFNSPNASIGAVAAGTISSASSPPSFQRTSRQLQTAAKLLF